MEDMIQYCRTLTVEQILEVPDVQERIERYLEQQTHFKEMLDRCCRVEGQAIITNLIDEEVVLTSVIAFWSMLSGLSRMSKSGSSGAGRNRTSSSRPGTAS